MDTVIDELVASAEEVHDVLGPGHTEATYHRALETELSSRGVTFSSETTIPVFYKSHSVGRRRPDMMIEGDDGSIVVELKASSPSGEEQLLDYQSLLGDDSNFDIERGVLIRFNEDVEIVKS